MILSLPNYKKDQYKSGEIIISSTDEPDEPDEPEYLPKGEPEHLPKGEI